MERKLIKHGLSSLTITLPTSWLKERGLRKGDSLNIDVQGNNLVIGSGKGISLDKAKVDVTGLDRTSIVLIIQSLYRYGYKEIEVYSKDKEAIHFRKNIYRNLSSIIYEAVNRLIGFEVTQSSLNDYTLQYIPEESDRNFKVVLRRIFRLLIEMMETLENGLEKNDKSVLESIEFQQINTIKFINYGLRILNIYGYPDVKKTSFYFYTIASLSKLHNSIVNCSRNVLSLKLKLNKRSIKSIKKINYSFELFYELFYDYNYKKIYELDKNRDDIKHEFFDIYKTLPKEDIYVVSSLIQIVEIILDLMEVRIGLEY